MGLNQNNTVKQCYGCEETGEGKPSDIQARYKAKLNTFSSAHNYNNISILRTSAYNRTQNFADLGETLQRQIWTEELMGTVSIRVSQGMCTAKLLPIFEYSKDMGEEHT